MFVKIKKFIKNNYQFLYSLILLIIIFLLAINPKPLISSSFKGLRVWAQIVVPSLLSFFILTKIFMLLPKSQKIFLPFSFLFNKIYNLNSNSAYIFFMSLISGYPMGIKLTSEFYKNNLISKSDCYKFLPIVSTSGLIFIMGTIANTLFNNKIAITVFLSHIIATLLNGLLYRKYKKEEIQKQKVCNISSFNKPNINEIMLESITQILMIGGYIAICFSLIELTISSKIFLNIKNLLPPIYNDIFESIFKGIIEMTNGCISISKLNLPVKPTVMLLTSLISFGGLSIHLQSKIFLSQIGIKYKFFLLTKVTQTLLSLFVSFILCLFL